MNSVRPQTLDEILQDLEHHFSSSDSQKKKKTPSPRKFNQNQIIGGLTLVLLVVGAAVGVMLGQQSQDVRQQAAPAYAAKCTNQAGPCGGEKFDADPCFDNEGFEGVCDNDFASDGICTCIWNDVCCKKPGTDEYLKTTGPSCKHQIFGSVVDDSFCESPKKCSTSAPTASACYGNEIGSRCTNFNGICVFTSTDTNTGDHLCACVADVQASLTPAQPTRPPEDITNFPPQSTEPPTEPTQIVALPSTQIIPTNTLTTRPSNTPLPSSTTIPSQTNTPRPTNTSIPTTPGQSTNTPVPLPTSTFSLIPSATSAIIALNIQTSPTPSVITSLVTSPLPTNIVFSITPVPTNISLGTGGGSAPTATRANIAQQPALPAAGNMNSSTQIILTVLTIVLIIGAIALLLFL
jgi:hypothetical protein